MTDQRRNLKPTLSAKVAMIIWGAEYSKQGGGSMDFWDGLSVDKQNRCRLAVTEIRKAIANEKNT